MSSPVPVAPSPKEHASIALEAWKKVVQTQEHFNEICMKVRTLYATVLAAILSLYGVMLKDTASRGIDVANLHVDPFMAVCVAVFVVTTLFYFVDKEWYHRLLLGAVGQGAAIEARWADILPEIQLGSKISENSPVDLSKRPVLVWFLKLFVKERRFAQHGRLHSDAKVEVFYKPVRGLALCAFVVGLLFGGVRYDGHSVAASVWLAFKSVCSWMATVN